MVDLGLSLALGLVEMALECWDWWFVCGIVLRVSRVLPFLFSFFSLVIVMACSIVSISVSAEIYPSLKFEKPKFEGEFSDERVEAGLIGRDGFVWLCTDDGLVRYDGYTAKRYTHDPKNSQSISTNRTESILEDQNGHLWIGTEKMGLNRFDPETEKFTRYLPESLKSTIIPSLYEDSLGVIWISTFGAGLVQLNPNTGVFTQYMPEKSTLNSIQDINVWKVLEDRKIKGNLWVATADGLDYFDRNKQIFTHYRQIEGDSSSLSNNAVNDVFYDSNGDLWIGTDNGLSKLESTSNTFSRLYPDVLNSHKFDRDNLVLSIFEDSHNQLILGTDGGGIKIFDRKTHTFVSYQNEPSNNYSLREDQISGFFEDTSGLLWILTTHGINQLNLSANHFKNYRNRKNNPMSLSGNLIWAIHEDQDDNLWIGTDKKGLNFFDKRTQGFINYRYEHENEGGLNSDSINSILVDSDFTLWVGTEQGLNRRDKNDKEFRHYTFDKGDTASSRVYSLLEDHLGLIWIGTTNGLIKFDKKNNLSVEYFNDKNKRGTIAHSWVASLFEDKSGQVWVGTAGGLDLYNRETDKFIHIKNDQRSKINLYNTVITVINQAKDGHLWVGTNGVGFFRLNIGSLEIEQYDSAKGLNSDIVYGILEDENGYLWITTTIGLSRFEPKTKEFHNFYSEDGIQKKGYNNLKSWTKRKSGEILIGGEHGFDAFFPDKITINSKPPTIVITDFLLFNRSVPIKSSIQPQKKEIKNSQKNTQIAPYYLEKNINHIKELTLTHKESMFSFEFAALDYLRPNKNQYAYKMEGVDKDWIHTPASKRFATYMNVPAGEYLFKVKGSNKNGVWNEEGRSIKVIILPPPWLTWWAKTIYVILAISLLVGFYSFRTASLRRRALELEKTVAERTQELSQEKTIVERRTIELAEEKQKVEKSLTQKTEEFANVSHEFRTPLTLILGPLSQLIKSNKEPDDIKRLNIIQRNGYRLLRMVDQLLNLETFRVKPVTQRQPINTAQTIRTLTEAFTDLANDKGIKIELNQLAHANFEFTADAFEKIILNLLSNALKYTKPGGSISIETSRKNDELMIQIIDTGIGIPADKLEAIFERFNRVLDKNSEQVTGAGIGLALVKNLVEAHQGKIDITSELGRGAQVMVTLPIINEVDESGIFQQANDDIIEMELMSLTEQAKQQMFADKQSIVQKESEQPTVLVIEDNQDMREYIVGSLGDDYRTLTASNGEEGIKLAKQEVPDLIISDIMMPKKDGFETTKELRADDITSHIPIILLTARGDHESRIKGWQEKADEYLTKPFNTEELKTRIVNLLEIRNILKRRFGETVFEPEKNADEIKASVRNDLSIAEKNKHQLQQQFVKLVNEKLEKRYSDASISIADLASSLAMSERQIFRKLKSTVDMTPTEYIRRFRLEKAKQQLLRGSSASNTAFDVGFSSQSYFAKCFKAQYGMSPREYVNQN